jgi:S1-C subfamily serine protease
VALRFFRKSTSMLSIFAAGVAVGAAGLGLWAPSQPKAAELAVVELTAGSARTELKAIEPTHAAQHTGAQAARTRLSSREIARRALEFTVTVRGGPVYGAGVLIDDRHVLTSDHVVEGVKKLEVEFYGGRPAQPAKVLARDKRLDLALLEIPSAPGSRTAATLGTIVDIEMGDAVYAMGTPRKLGFSLSRGVVSYVGRSFDGTLHLQTDLATNSGSSGGPILNERGEVVAITSFILRGSQGLAFGVPIDYAFRRFRTELASRDESRFERWLATHRATGPATSVEQSAPTVTR